MPDTPDCVRVAVSSDSPITAAARPARDALATRLTPAPQIVATDGELLTQFTRRGDRGALDRLVDRHSAMVWRVCRATLRRPQDVEDAFQATFLLLTKNARSIKSSESAAGWLYRVAYRTSLRARKKLSLRREEALAVDPHAPSEAAFPDLLQKQTTGVLVEELMRLPAKYQTPLVLRYLEGQSRRAIADQTDTTIAGVQGRLARGKQMLRRRLLRRGVSLAAVMGALGLGARGAAAAENAPARVVVQTTSNSAALATGGSVAASAGVLSLYQEGVRAMLVMGLAKPMASAAALVAAALLLMPPGEAGETQAGAAAVAPGALRLQVGLEALAPAIADDGAVELAQATPNPAPDTAVLQAERIELSSRDNRLVQLRAEGDVTVTAPEAEVTTVFVPGPPVPPANERERLARLLALREQLIEMNRRQGQPGLPGGSPASKRLLGLIRKTDLAIGQITGKQITEQLAVFEKELAVLTQTASRRRESSEEPLANTPPAGVGGSPEVDEPLKELGYAPVPEHIRARLRAMLADFSGVKVEVSDEQEGRLRASIAVPSSYVEAVHRLNHPDQPIDKEALRQTQEEVAAQIEEIAMPLLPRLPLGENEYEQVHVTVYAALPDEQPRVPTASRRRESSEESPFNTPPTGVGGSPTKTGIQPIKSDKKPNEPQKAERPKWPVIVKSVPERGATDVDADLTEVRVTFDRDMQRGMSWTGGRKSFMPETPPGAQARWVDNRTCVLPVHLKRGEFYRVGINAKSYQNFKSADGVPAAHGVIAFSTKGAKRSVARRVRTPKVVEMTPADGDTSVNPGETQLRVTFDTKMGAGMSWTNTPTAPFPDAGGGRAAWSRDGRTCTLPVKLEPGRAYAVGLNASHAVNFQSEHGVPLPPVVWKFATGEGLASDETSRRRESSEEPLAGAKPKDLHTAARAPGRVDHTDGRADGKKSLGGSGHLIKFELPEGAVGVKSVRVHGSRYGTKTAPREDFEISFLSEDRSEILDIRRGAYGLFRRGAEKWTNVRFKDPVVDLPETFWVAIDFSPGRTKGVYLSYDTSTGGERSMTGLAQQEPGEHKPVTFGGDWMVSVVLERADAASLVSPGEATQPVAKAEADAVDGHGAMVEPGVELLPFVDDGGGAYAHKGREYGYSVSQLQARLNDTLDPTPGLEVDDDYGPMTTRAVERFQREAGLAVTGFADAATRDALGFVEPGARAAPPAADPTPHEERAIKDAAEAPEELLAALRATTTYQEAPPEVQEALEERLNKGVGEADRYDLAEGDQRYVLGRVALAEGDEPELVAAQMKILPGGYFLDLLGDALRPIGFRRHGYEPLDLDPAFDKPPLADLGRLELTKSVEFKSRKLRMELVDEAGRAISAKLSIRQLNGPINTPSNGYEPRPRFAPPVHVKELHGGQLVGYSPIAYGVRIEAEGYVSQSRRIDFSKENEIDLGEITLEKPKSVELEYLVFRGDTPVSPVVFDPAAFTKKKRLTMKAGDKFVADPEHDPHRTEFKIRQEGGRLSFDNRYGSSGLADLGPIGLDALAGTSRRSLDRRDEPTITSGHVYLMRFGQSGDHLLMRARISEGGPSARSERLRGELVVGLETIKQQLAAAERLHERVGEANSDIVGRVLTKSRDRRLAAAANGLRSVRSGLERLAAHLVEEAGDEDADFEKLLEPVVELTKAYREVIESVQDAGYAPEDLREGWRRELAPSE